MVDTTVDENLGGENDGVYMSSTQQSKTIEKSEEQQQKKIISCDIVSHKDLTAESKDHKSHVVRYRGSHKDRCHTKV